MDEALLAKSVAIDLRTDEAVVLLWYLSREIWNEGERRLISTFEHPAEAHALNALLQELAGKLIYTGASAHEGIEAEARTSLIQRYGDIATDGLAG